MYFYKFSTFHKNYMLFFYYFLFLYNKKIFFKITIFTPTYLNKIVKILKSPHVNKKSIETFEKRFYIFLMRFKQSYICLLFLLLLKKLNIKANFSIFYQILKKDFGFLSL
jgi:hypothetical protein